MQNIWKFNNCTESLLYSSEGRQSDAPNRRKFGGEKKLTAEPKLQVVAFVNHKQTCILREFPSKLEQNVYFFVGLRNQSNGLHSMLTFHFYSFAANETH